METKEEMTPSKKAGSHFLNHASANKKQDAVYVRFCAEEASPVHLFRSTNGPEHPVVQDP